MRTNIEQSGGFDYGISFPILKQTKKKKSRGTLTRCFSKQWQFQCFYEIKYVIQIIYVFNGDLNTLAKLSYSPIESKIYIYFNVALLGLFTCNISILSIKIKFPEQVFRIYSNEILTIEYFIHRMESPRFAQKNTYLFHSYKCPQQKYIQC